jgi:hypothetical protein
MALTIMPGAQIAALQRSDLGKCLLKRVERALFRHTFDRRDLQITNCDDGKHARANGLAADQDRASTTGALTAPRLGTGQAELLAENRKQAAFVRGGHQASLTVDDELERFRHPNLLTRSPDNTSAHSAD